MSEHRQWQFYFSDMLKFARKVRDYTDELDQASFLESEMIYDATLRNLELIGEAARGIPDPVRDRYPQIPWRMIVALRNRLIHAYFGLDDDVVWSIIVTDIPLLIEECLQIEKDLSAE